MKKHIFIVDDDPYILDAIRYFLEDAGYSVSTTQQGKDAEQLIRKKDALPDLIILDVLLSGKDGREICQKIKRSKGIKNIPVILISSGLDSGRSAKTAGADGFLAKPFDVQELLTIVEKHLVPSTRKHVH